MDKGQLAAEDILPFMLSGKALIHFENLKTQNIVSYYVVKLKTGIWWIYSSKEKTFYMGYINKSRKLFLRNVLNTMLESEKIHINALEYIWKKLNGEGLPDSIITYHSGECGVCGRPLTDLESIKRGIGPVCLEKV